MKKWLFTCIILMVSVSLLAQSEAKSDTPLSTTANKQFESMFLDFISPATPHLPKFDASQLLGPDMTRDYSMLFQPNESWTFGETVIEMAPAGYISGTFSNPKQVQMATLKLNENMRLGIYGQYTAEGKRIPGTNLFPWDKNSFVGGMELKFKNNIGIRLEVRQGGKNPLYPY